MTGVYRLLREGPALAWKVTRSESDQKLVPLYQRARQGWSGNDEHFRTQEYSAASRQPEF